MSIHKSLDYHTKGRFTWNEEMLRLLHSKENCCAVAWYVASWGFKDIVVFLRNTDVACQSFLPTIRVAVLSFAHRCRHNQPVTPFAFVVAVFIVPGICFPFKTTITVVPLGTSTMSLQPQ